MQMFAAKLALAQDAVILGSEVERVGQPGEHIGLSIMDERARRLGGELKIESEPGDGTRIELFYRPAGQVRFQEAQVG